MVETLPVLVDTDIGTTIDDTLALAYLLCQPRCDLLGISTVSGNVAQRAAVAALVCETAGRSDIPIAIGLEGPSASRLEIPEYGIARAIRPHLKLQTRPRAVEFMWQTIRERPNEITLLTLGPLTNIAALFELRPEARRLLKSWVSMAGSFEAGAERVEWNCQLDPVAARTAFELNATRHLHVGLNVSERCRLATSTLSSKSEDPLLGLVMRLGEDYFQTNAEVKMHDPLAAEILFKPGLCSFSSGRVEVDRATGSTSFAEGACGLDEVAMAVDSEAASAEYLQILSRRQGALPSSLD